MARDGVFWRPLARVHPQFRTPAVSILTQAIVSCSFVIGVTGLIVSYDSLKGKDVFDVLTNFVVYSANIFYAMCVGAVYILRVKFPNLHRPYRTWGYPIVPGLYLIAMGWFLWAAFEASPFESSVALGLMLGGLPIYGLILWFDNSSIATSTLNDEI